MESRQFSERVFADAETWESERGRVVITQPVLGVIVFTYSGYATLPAVAFIEEAVDRVLAKDVRPDLFIDLDDLDGYDTAYRRAISEWGVRKLSRFGEVRVMVRSRIVAMGIAVSNLTAANKLKPTTKRLEFDAAIEAAIARHSIRPPPS